MECSKIFSKILIGILFALPLLGYGSTSRLYSIAFSVEHAPRVGWIFGNSGDIHSRIKRESVSVSKTNKLIDDSDCRSDLHRLCGSMDKNDDDLSVLECIQTFKANELSGINNQCQHKIWIHTTSLTSDDNVQKLIKQACPEEADSFMCGSKDTSVSYLSCIIDQREHIKEPQCLEYLQRLEWVAFSDFRIITHFVSDCQGDIEKFQCGRIQAYREMSQGLTLACLQRHVDQLEGQCRKRILHVSEIQADNIKLDRQLYMACTQDHIKFCPNIRPGSGRVYKCLMQYKTDRAMTKQCQDQLTRREKLIASDYKVSKGLVRACKEDIRGNHCRRSVSEDKEIRLAQILLCLESASRNGSKITADCQVEMFDHRKILMEDYRLSPEIVDGCAADILSFCNGLEVGGKTIHCLMEHTRARKKKSRVSAECQRALEGLIKETDAGEDWRIDPVLREACQPVVAVACNDVRGGNARVISCLMEKLGTDRMTEACETALVQIQYFVARDFKLDPQLYKACKADAMHFCHAKNAWANDGIQMDPERGPLVLPCLYRYAYHPQKNMTLKNGCLKEIRRVMRQRAINVDLQPEIEEVCLNELAMYCYDKTAKREETLCLQDNLDSLNERCKLAVGNLTEEQAERVELNPVVTGACQHVMEQYCEEVLKVGKDEGDLMECLIEHKNDLDVHFDYKCKAAVEHFQLISLKSYHFTYKFKDACRPYVMRWCPSSRFRSKTKADVIECLSTVVQEDIMKDTQHRVPRECRQQLRAQLYQQRENINFDPTLQKLCATDVKQLCFDVKPGRSQILECLASQKHKLSEQCHTQLFKVRKQEFQDSSSDFALLEACRSMISLFCNYMDGASALSCLKVAKNRPSFDEKCKSMVVRRMIEQNTDYRFNVALQSACVTDIDRHCKEVLMRESTVHELEGKVIKCLKIKFRESKLTAKCELQMTSILKEAALNYHLNPLLATLCSTEVETICPAEDMEPGDVEECLKAEFKRGNQEMKEECRLEVADLIEQRKVDINVDPLLQKACAIDVSKYCSDIPQGAGRHIKCLQNSLRSLQPDCYKMLTARLEMFRLAEKLIQPNSIKELYYSVSSSSASTYFMIIAVSIIGIIFVMGLFCGRVTRRAMMMKHK
ncbi:Golgi apparatus protein 1 isoform X2 [Cephus cinctus]|uniref:Golgi apparatus protein 1 isoform X2 n=1 Tax=Cephus cinctus TaxID=211228 RepID=A0AAJ7FUB0_CEPCN|nr:Golgi apparatus protein 1 isoform X2 [Cephus cinctus]